MSVPVGHGLARDTRVFVAGHRGLVGSAVWRRLETAGFTELYGATFGRARPARP